MVSEQIQEHFKVYQGNALLAVSVMQKSQSLFSVLWKWPEEDIQHRPQWERSPKRHIAMQVFLQVAVLLPWL